MQCWLDSLVKHQEQLLCSRHSPRLEHQRCQERRLFPLPSIDPFFPSFFLGECMVPWYSCESAEEGPYLIVLLGKGGEERDPRLSLPPPHTDSQGFPSSSSSSSFQMRREEKCDESAASSAAIRLRHHSAASSHFRRRGEGKKVDPAPNVGDFRALLSPTSFFLPPSSARGRYFPPSLPLSTTRQSLTACRRTGVPIRDCRKEGGKNEGEKTLFLLLFLLLWCPNQYS